MDTGKLLKVIEDIQADEKEFKFQAKFQKILDLYAANNPDPLNSEKKLLEKELYMSRLGNYVLTDFKILEGLKIESFFGERSWIELNNILDSQAHEVAKKFTEFVSKRQDTLTKIAVIKDSLNIVGIIARQLSEKEYEIGFSFPDEYQKLTNFEEVLKDIQLFLVSIASATKEDKEFRINYVSNGTIEIFISATQTLAQYFGIALEYALKIYETVQMAGALKKSYQHFSKDNKDIIDKIAETEKETKSKALIKEMIKELKISEPDDDNRVSMLFSKILRHLENGVSAEVKTPLIDEPADPKESDDKETKTRLQELRHSYDFKKSIEARNKKIFKLQQNKFYGSSTGFLSDGTQLGNKDSDEDI